MLYLAIPAQNEVATIGVLLWRLRTVLAEFPREYEVVVYDDASADETADVAEQYAHAMPVTVLRGAKPVGYAGAVDALVRYISGQTRYPRRDAMLLLQGDFTDPPGIVPEFARRFEGGADLVVGERTAVVDAPTPVKRLFSAAGWALRPFVKVDGVKDLTGSMRLVRISVLRDALRLSGDAPLCEGDSWTANADLLLRLVPHARRVESVPMEPTYGVRMRETRRVTVRDALATLRWGWRARGRRAVPTTAPESTSDTNARPPRSGPGATNGTRRREEPEMTAERLRERKRDRDRPRTDSSLEDAAELARRERGRRDRREARAETLDREAIDPAAPRDAVDPVVARALREERPSREERAPRDERAPHEERPRRDKDRKRGRDKERPGTAELDGPLDDPFAAPASSSRRGSRDGKPPVEDSPYSDEPPTRGRRSETAATPPRSPARTTPAPVEAGDESGGELLEQGAALDGSDELLDGAGAAGAGEDGADGTDPATRERKRRRNRRSRRRKGRGAKSGEAGETGEAENEGGADGEGESESSESENGAPVAEPRHRQPRRSARPASDSDGDSRGDGDGGAANAGAFDADGAGGDGDHGDISDGDSADAGLSEEAAAQARAKRRGRRGRRGGARRSRNRGKADGAADAAGDSSAGEGASDAPQNGGGRDDGNGGGIDQSGGA